MQSPCPPLCEFSHLPATKVCMHPSCEQIPFLCSSECVSNACTKLHKHNGEFRLLDYSSFLQIVAKLQDPNRMQQQVKEEITKSIVRMIESMTLMLDRFQRTMSSQDMIFRTSAIIVSTLSKLHQQQHDRLTGRQLSNLLDGAAAENQHEIEIKVRAESTRVANIVESIEELLNCYHGIYSFREKAQKHLNQAIRKSTTSLADSMHEYNKSVEFNPNNPISFLGRAAVHAQLSNFGEALRDYNRVLNLDPNNHEALNAKGVILQDNKSQPKQALVCFSKAIALNPLEVKYRLNRCNALIETGEYGKALQDITLVIEQKPDERWFYIKRAEIYRSLGLKKQAQLDETKAEQQTKN